MKATLILALLVLALIPASPASADPAKVEALIHDGVELRKQGLDHRAMPFFKQAYDLERSPRTAAQLGLVEAQLGYWLSAEKHLTEALSSTRNPWLAKHEAQLRSTLENVRASIGELEIKGSPPGAEVIVNGQPAGRLPLPGPVRVPEGAVQITLRAEGHVESSTSMVIGGGKRTNVTIALQRTPEPGRTASAAETATSPPEGAATEADQPVQRPAERERGASWLRPVAWVSLVGGVAAAGLGAYGLRNQRARAREFDNYVQPGTSYKPCNLEARDKGGDKCRSIHEKMAAGKNLAIVGFATAGALLTGAVVGFLLSSPADDALDDGPEAAWSLHLAPATVAVDWRLSF